MFKKEQQYTIKAHNNEFGHRRSFTMYVRSPDQGINDQTGVLLVVQNLRTKANSVIWNEIRSRLSSQYNMVTIGLNYQGAGWTGRADSYNYALHVDAIQQLNRLLPAEMRSSGIPEDPEKFLALFAGRDLTEHDIEMTEAQDLEFWKNYPDYGFIQAIDCLWALGALKQICREKQFSLNWKRTYAYGINEGGHIVQMCGRLAPHTFALIIDNSGYPYITIETMIGGNETREKRWISAGGHSIGVYVKLPKTYGLSKDARYYITEDMIEIRDLRRFQVGSKTKCVMIQTEGDNADKRGLYETMIGQGRDAEYEVIEESINQDNVVSQFESYADRYMAEESMEKLEAEGISDFELGTRIVFNTTNGRYVLDYSSGSPMIEFEGDIVALRLAEEEVPTANNEECLTAEANI